MTRLSVVIVSYNTRDLLRDCLQSLAVSPAKPEVIVVDNASRDGSAAMVASEFPQVRLLAQTENTWFCGGNNIGIRAATGDYVLLLNPDTVVKPHALVTLLGFLERNRDYLGATAQLRYPDGTVQRTCSAIPTYTYLLLNHTPLGILRPRLRKRIHAKHWYANWDRTSSRDVEVLPGSCLMMRRTDMLLDDDLWLYFPEDDLARRFKGESFRYVASAQITHREKSSTQTWLATRVYYRDMLIYTRKHHSAGKATLLWALSRPLLVAMWLRSRFRRR